MTTHTTNTIEQAASPGMEKIRAERKRQIEVEGWTYEHDDKYANGELARAASSYESAYHEASIQPHKWPWDRAWWKPKDRVSNLVRAGALYLAESERLERKGENTRANHWRQWAEIIAVEINTEMKSRPEKIK